MNTEMVKPDPENPSTYLGYSLGDFVQFFPDIAHVKDAHTLQYQLSNQKNLAIFGFKSAQDIVGKSVFDLEEVMQDKWPEGYAQKVHNEDMLVIQSRTPHVSHDRSFLNKEGFLIVHTFMKIPIFNVHQDLVSILTLVFDATKKENVEGIREKYRSTCASKLLADQRFLNHIGFHVKDNEHMTSREIDCLIALAKHKQVKPSASELNMSPKTLETHIKNIKQKTGICSTQQIVEVFMTSFVDSVACG